MKKAFFTLLLLLVNSLCIAYPYIYADDVCKEPYVPGIYSAPDETIIVEEGSTISQNIIQTQTIQKERVGLIRGTAMFVGSAIRLVGDTIGEGLYQGSQGLDSMNITPERIVNYDNTITVIQQQRPTRRIIKYRNKCYYSPEIFGQIMRDYLKSHFGENFRYLTVSNYYCADGIYFGEIVARFNDHNGRGEDYAIQASGKATELKILQFIIKEKIKNARIRFMAEE